MNVNIGYRYLYMLERRFVLFWELRLALYLDETNSVLSLYKEEYESF